MRGSEGEGQRVRRSEGQRSEGQRSEGWGSKLSTKRQGPHSDLALKCILGDPNTSSRYSEQGQGSDQVPEDSSERGLRI